MNLEEQLAAWINGVVTVVGIGNRSRGDDGAGSLVAARIASLPAVHPIDAQETPENFVVQVVEQRPDTVVLIDSVDMDSAPGSITLLSRDQMAGYLPNTHRVPMSLLADVLEHETRARVFGIGIQPAHTDFLQPMSRDVMASVEDLADLLNRVLAANREAHL